MVDSIPQTTEPAEQVNATRARQGLWGRHMAWVLVVSFVLAAVAMALSWSFFAGRAGTAADVQAEPADSQTFNTDTSVVKQQSDTAGAPK